MKMQPPPPSEPLSPAEQDQHPCDQSQTDHHQYGETICMPFEGNPHEVHTERADNKPKRKEQRRHDREDKGAARQLPVLNAGNLIVEDINAVPQVLQGFKIPQKLIEPVIDPRALSFAQKGVLAARQVFQHRFLWPEVAQEAADTRLGLCHIGAGSLGLMSAHKPFDPVDCVFR